MCVCVCVYVCVCVCVSMYVRTREKSTTFYALLLQFKGFRFSRRSLYLLCESESTRGVKTNRKIDKIREIR